jgi:hypothetical protein
MGIAKAFPIVLLAGSLVLLVVLVGQGVGAQGTDIPVTDRTGEGSGKRGEIQGLTLEQLPALQPPDLTVLYHFAGVLNDDTTAVEKATVLQCTNVDDAKSAQIEVQLFDYNASSVYTGTINVAPFRTATFESMQVDFYLSDVLMDTGFLGQGYGRILTEHSNIICTVQTVDPNNDPPDWSFDIPVYTRGFGGALLPAVLKNATP